MKTIATAAVALLALSASAFANGLDPCQSDDISQWPYVWELTITSGKTYWLGSNRSDFGDVKNVRAYVQNNVIDAPVVNANNGNEIHIYRFKGGHFVEPAQTSIRRDMTSEILGPGCSVPE